MQFKITFYIVLLVALIINSVGWFLYFAARHYFDEELGKKLISIAHFAAESIEPDLLVYLKPGDENGEFYGSIQVQLQKFDANFNLTHSYLINPDFKMLVDSKQDGEIGSSVVHLQPHLLELQAALQGNARYTVLYQGNDNIYYKSAFAPLQTKDNTITAICCVDASPEFLQVLVKIKNSILFINSISFVIAVILSFFLAKSIVNPIRKLVTASERMSQGELTRPVEISSRDEIGYLGMVFNSMQEAIRLQHEKLQNRIEEKERLAYLGELSAAVAHEIRNPLNSIELYMGLLQRQINPPAEVASNIVKIHKEIQSLNAIVTSFLKFARQPELVLTKVLLSDLVQESLFLASKDLKEKDIEVRVNLGKKDVTLNADANQLKQALLNVILNAIQSMPQSGTLAINVHNIEENNFILLQISDTGCGISKDNLDKLFQPFFSTRNRGTGLGLAIVKNIVEAHHGIVFVDSEEKKGTTISLKLPMEKA
ncbi:MAG: HAMP domain-containing protein [Deferribacteres bacterium]|nr:HAMP domain-containing protein [candidate division KSB1 bacterium]MCB9503403.1 HAMP domain-containing protein [Deferribacteres bacterium]